MAHWKALRTAAHHQGTIPRQGNDRRLRIGQLEQLIGRSLTKAR